jgi:uncharacterized secreted protein with C-terminal beta-propeller domain
MRKSTLFISAVLTTFMLAIMFGVASAYQKIVKSAGPTGVVVQSQSTDVSAPVAANTMPAATMTIEQAADLASNVIGRSDLYAAENTQLDGVDAYLVTFSSGDLVYVSLDGKIMSISKLPVTYVLGQSSNGGGNQNSGNNNGGGSSSVINPPATGGDTNSHEGGDEGGDSGDHEDGDD